MAQRKGRPEVTVRYRLYQDACSDARSRRHEDGGAVVEAGWWKQLALRAGLYLVAVLALGSAVAKRQYGLTIVAAVAVCALGVVLHRRLAGLEKTSLNPGRKAMILVAMCEVGLVLCVTRHLDIFTPVGFAGVSIALLGFGQLAAEIRESSWFQLPVAILLWVNLLGAVALALVGIGGWLVFAAGFLLLPPTLSITTELLLDRVPVPSPVTWAMAGAVYLVGMALLWPVGGFRFLLILGLLTLALVGTWASNTDADMLFILVAFALIWSQFPRDAGIQPIPEDSGQIVAFGDSYISGEGAGTYFSETNVRSTEDRDECRRSPSSYPVVVARDLGMRLDDLACSGAVATNLTGTGQYFGENPVGMRSPDPVTATLPPKLGQLALYDLRPPDLSKVQTVLVSIGGNDVGFGSLVETCLAPGDCAERGQHWLDGLKDLPDKLGPVYDALRAKFGDRVVVVPYPIPIRGTGCNILQSTFTDKEHAFINGFAKELDQVIRVEAAKHHVHYLSDMEGVFARNEVRICDTSARDTGVNYLALNPVQGRIDPSGWLHNSMHPNATGHALMAGVVKNWIARSRPEAEDASAVPGTSLALPEVTALGNPAPAASLRNACSGESPASDCKLSDSAWIYKHTHEALFSHLPVVTLVLGGAEALWVCLLRTRRKTTLKPFQSAAPGAGR